MEHKESACAACGTDMVVRLASQRYCSERCRKRDSNARYYRRKHPDTGSAPVGVADGLLNLSDAGKVLGVSRERVRQLVRAGQLDEHGKVGRERLVREQDVVALAAVRAS